MTTRPRRNWLLLLTLLTFVLGSISTGCIVRTGSSSQGVRHAHKHCHNKRVRRGNAKVVKRKCHRHRHSHNRRGGGHH